jgi:hypothetical protein
LDEQYNWFCFPVFVVFNVKNQLDSNQTGSIWTGFQFGPSHVTEEY